MPPILAAAPAAHGRARSPGSNRRRPIREFLSKRGSGSLADSSFAAVMLLCALSIFAIVLFILGILIIHSTLSLAAVRLELLHPSGVGSGLR